jgi:hypothetical protein
MNVNLVIFHQAAIGDYIFLIMIVLASVIQAISQNKKKKALREPVQTGRVQTSNPQDDVLQKKAETGTGNDKPFDTIFDSIGRVLVPDFEDESHTWGDDYPVTATERKNQYEVVDYSDIAKALSADYVASEHMEPVIPKPVTLNPVSSYRPLFRDGFNLKKAVIYSEILNKKYS